MRIKYALISRKSLLLILFTCLFLFCIAQEGKQIVAKRDSLGLFGTCNTTENLGGKVFTKMEILPAFPGGSTRWFEFAQANLNFQEIRKLIPDSALIYRDSVVVRFVVPREGGLCQLIILNSPSEVLKNAITNLFKMSPDWTPGTNGNRNLIGYRTLKVEILIDKEKENYKVVRNLDHYYFVNE